MICITTVARIKYLQAFFFFFLPEGKRIVFIFFRKEIVGRYIVEQTQISLLTAVSWEASIFWHWVAGWLTAD